MLIVKLLSQYWIPVIQILYNPLRRLSRLVRCRLISSIVYCSIWSRPEPPTNLALCNLVVNCEGVEVNCGFIKNDKLKSYFPKVAAANGEGNIMDIDRFTGAVSEICWMPKWRVLSCRMVVLVVVMPEEYYHIVLALYITVRWVDKLEAVHGSPK